MRENLQNPPSFYVIGNCTSAVAELKKNCEAILLSGYAGIRFWAEVGNMYWDIIILLPSLPTREQTCLRILPAL